MRKFVTCPEHGHLCEIEYQINPVDGHRMAVSSCTHFHPPDWVDCESECVRRLNARDEELTQIRHSGERASETPETSET